METVTGYTEEDGVVEVETLPAVPMPFDLNVDGLSVTDTKEKKNGEIEETTYRLCGHLLVDSKTQDEHGGNRGRLLKFKDDLGHSKELVMDMMSLAGDGRDIIAKLLGMGLLIESPHMPNTRNKLMQYLSRCQPERMLTAVSTTGWHGESFILPDETFGSSDDVVLSGAQTSIYTQRGTLEEWQQHVGALCLGNSRLLFSTAFAFCGPLMPLTGDDSAGVNWVGDSSTGKSTSQCVAASVWGNPEPGKFLAKWNMTPAALEVIAALRNHAFLPIDELGEVDGKAAGPAMYQLASGVMKGRGKAEGGIRDLKTWKTPFLSSAEKTLAQHVEDAGKRVYAGQQTRMVDIFSDAGCGMGAFEELHQFLEQHEGNVKAAGAAFADKLKANATKYHGTASRAFLRALLERGTDKALGFIAAQRDEFMARLPASAGGQVRRASKLFALIAAAGELASDLGVTGWPAGAAFEAVGRVHDDWLAENGSGNLEEKQALTQIRLFLELHGESRLRRRAGDEERVIQNHAGWYELSVKDGTVDYYLKPMVFEKEICKGFRKDAVIGWLDARGLLRYNPGRKQLRFRANEGAVWVYCISSKIFDDDNSDGGSKRPRTPRTPRTDDDNNNKNNDLECSQSVLSPFSLDPDSVLTDPTVIPAENRVGTGEAQETCGIPEDVPTVLGVLTDSDANIKSSAFVWEYRLSGETEFQSLKVGSDIDRAQAIAKIKALHKGAGVAELNPLQVKHPGAARVKQQLDRKAARNPRSQLAAFAALSSEKPG